MQKDLLITLLIFIMLFPMLNFTGYSVKDEKYETHLYLEGDTNNGEDNNKYASVDVSFIESFVNKIEKTFWDAQYGGYFYSAKFRNIINYTKSLSVIARAMEAYSKLYNETKKEEYKNKVYDLISLSEKFRHKPSNLYYGFLNRDFSQLSTKNHLYDLYGNNSVISNIIFANSLLTVYEILKNDSILVLSKNICKSIYQELWDQEYGGIYSLDANGNITKDVEVNAGFLVLNLRLYLLTNEQEFLERAKAMLKIVDSMWYDGFFHSYDKKFNPINTMRYPPEKVIELPAYAYLLSYKIFGEEKYLTKSLRLINISLFYSWKVASGGTLLFLDQSYESTNEFMITSGSTLYYLSLIRDLIDDSIIKNYLRRRIAGYIKLLLSSFITQYGFPYKRGMFNKIKDYTIFAANQFYIAYSILLAKEMLKEDKNPPIFLYAYIEGNHMFIRVVDLESRVEGGILIMNKSWYALLYFVNKNEYLFQYLDEYKGGDCTIQFDDDSKNTLTLRINIESLPRRERGEEGNEKPVHNIPSRIYDYFLLICILLIVLVFHIIFKSKVKVIERVS